MTAETQFIKSLSAREKSALHRVEQVLTYFETTGVSATSLGTITSDAFSGRSDVNFLIFSCPDHLCYRIESSVEDIMGPISFDVVYYDTFSENFKSRLAKLNLPIKL